MLVHKTSILLVHLGVCVEENEDHKDANSDATVSEQDFTLVEKVLDSLPESNVGQSAATNQGQ